LSNNNFVPLTSVDFGTLKTAITAFLQGQNVFKDYNFKGSALSVLTDILAWNTTYNAFYMNMLNSESHLDSAQLLGSVISHAKDLNYTPRSARSAEANLTMSFASSNATFVIEKGSTFSSIINANNYMFSVTDNIIAASSNGTFSVDLPVAEGSYFQDTYVMAANNQSLSFELKNKNPDSTSITVVVYENGSTVGQTYTFATTLLGLNETSKVYFLAMNYRGRYEIQFGDGAVGYQPSDGAIIVIDYRVTSGSLGNGGINFTPNFSLPGVSNLAITVNSGSFGGSDVEDIESIRFHGPRHFQVQERGIVPSDYVELLSEQFPEIHTASAYGGETLKPPQYGRIYIAVDISGVDGVPLSLQQSYEQFLKGKTMMTPVIVAATFTFWSITASINYNINISTLTPQSIETLCIDTVNSFNEDNLNDFGVTLYNSQLEKAIEDTDHAIVSVISQVKLYKKIEPQTLTNQQLTVDFGVQLFKPYTDPDGAHPDQDNHTISSDTFLYGTDVVYIEDDGNGNLKYVKSSGALQYILTVGTIDYDTGVLQFSNLYINSFFGNHIKIFAKTRSKDIAIPPSTILTIEPDQINLTVKPIRV